MFQHHTVTAQLAADHRVARSSDADRHRNRRAAGDVAEYAADVGEYVAAVGIDEARADVDAAVALARGRGVGTSLADIVTDPTQPTVARERALGRLLVILTSDQTRRRSSQPAA